MRRNEYRDLADPRTSIREFLEKVYNRKRLHSALGCVPPAELEANQKDALRCSLLDDEFPIVCPSSAFGNWERSIMFLAY